MSEQAGAKRLTEEAAGLLSALMKEIESSPMERPLPPPDPQPELPAIMEENGGRLQIGFDVAELQVISLKPGDILSAKLIGDEYDVDTMASLREHLKRVFPNNEVMVFAMPNGSDIQFQAIKPEEPKGYCNDCDCGKREQGESNGS